MTFMKSYNVLVSILTIYTPNPSVDSAFQKSVVTKGVAEVMRSWPGTGSNAAPSRAEGGHAFCYRIPGPTFLMINAYRLFIK